MIAVITKNTAQGVSTLKVIKLKNDILAFSSQSTSAPEDAAIIVRPAVPMDASKAYWVAV